MAEKEDYVKWFSELSSKDVGVAGGKGASLAEMYNNKFPIPPGFAITAQAYRYFIEKTGIKQEIEKILESLDINDTNSLDEETKKIRELIIKSNMPGDLKEQIIEAYEILDVDKRIMKNAREGGALEILRTSHEPPFVAVRSSATAEDLVDASFAGQQDTFLNVKGGTELIQKVKRCFASLYTSRATYYREKKGFKHSETYLSVIVQKMIDSEKSGVIFSENPVKKDKSVLIEAVYGLGEGIVSGRIKPDNYIVKGNLEEFKILSESIAQKKIAIVRDSSGKNKIVKLTEERSNQRVLNNYEIKILAQYAKQLENHYKKPQDIEFAIEGEKIYVVQSRPITTVASDEEEGEINGEILIEGTGASPGIGGGKVRIVKDMGDLNKVEKGDILVTEMTNPDMVVTMQKASGIITDEGGLTSHAAIVSREMGIPAIVGAGDATTKLKDGQEVTVYGGSGKVVEGASESKVANVEPVVETKTKIKVIVDLPKFAERAAKSKVKGVGLTRLEGIIASSGKHPMWYVENDKIRDYIEVLYNGLRKILENFEEIWIRTSDIRSDEYRNLEGSSKEVEGNPMLGDHGIRFGLEHPEILKAELTAAKEIADDFPDKKVGIMMPGVISSEEIRKTKKIAEEIGTPKNVRIGIMIETPAAVELINDFCEEGISFISFGTNDLTQYILAVDRNNSEVQNIYNEMNPAVLNAIKYVIRRCRRNGVETSICGQAGSREEMVKFLVGEKIDSISVNADAAKKISELVARLEKGEEVERGNDKEKEKYGKNEEEVSDKKNTSGEYGLVHPHYMNKIINYLKKYFAKDSQHVIKNQNNTIQVPPSGNIEFNELQEKKEKNKIKESDDEGADIEQEMLSELDDEFEDRNDGKNSDEVDVKEINKGEKMDEENEYMPSVLEDTEKRDIPPLNESIPVDANDLVEKDKGDDVLNIF